MTTIDQIDFSKLKPYDGKVTKCFEQLCYQLAQREYSQLGNFTPIDGSGGDGGVEFYLELTNGEKWGWQCKFFGDTGRLNAGSRKTQIENSLETACRNHPNLTRWVLCLKTDFTLDSTSPDGKVSKGEKDWFENNLPAKIPAGRTVILEHWGESKILTLLNSVNQIGIRQFFFGELEFTGEWFKKRFEENFEKVRDKYDPALHSIDQYTQSKLDFILFDAGYTKQLAGLKKHLLDKIGEIQSALNKFRDEKMISALESSQRTTFVLNCEEFKTHTALVFEKIEFIENCFKNHSEQLLSKFNLSELIADYRIYLDKIDCSIFKDKSRAQEDAYRVWKLISDFGNIYVSFFRNYFHKSQREIYFLANAAKGKTHLSCDIAFKKIQNGMPAIFITGDKFTGETSIAEALKQILDISDSYTFDDFIQALDVYGSILKVRIPIIIDGLNETTYNRLFSTIWKDHIRAFAIKLLNSQNIAFIATCRNSYAKRIWEKTNDDKFYFLHGFEDYETIRDAVAKYFHKYRLRASLFFVRLEKFKDPIFLRIFCEIKNPNWKDGVDVEVNVEEDSLFDVFKEYLDQVNKKITSQSHLFRENEPFISESLAILANYLWTNGIREISIEQFYQLIDRGKEYNKDSSRAEILIHEGLVVTRDFRDAIEYVSFTYDTLAGFLIGINLINSHAKGKYLITGTFINKIISDEGQHPLYEDIMSALCLLLPQLTNTSFHEILQQDKKLTFTKRKLFKYLPRLIKQRFKNRIAFGDYVFSTSVVSLFSLPHQYVKEKDLKLVGQLFSMSSQNKNTIFDLSLKTLSDIKHPLNAIFVSRMLESMEMAQRDISWTEYIRKKAYDLDVLISEFIAKCKQPDNGSIIEIQKQHLISKIVIWLLTSTNRTLRDRATQALYYYGKKFPAEFLSLVQSSLKINDPYVWERTLASLYGLTLAERNSFKSDKFASTILPEIGKNIYTNIFSKEAKHSTTHILARDYARRTIEIALIYHPTLLTKEEIVQVRPPYSFGGIRELGEYDYGEREYDYEGPMRMDFSNYTLGRIVEDGHAYANPPEKQKVRRQIHWRVNSLGWSADLFKNAEHDSQNDGYNEGRTTTAKVERYGKKYSWIAFYENAGIRCDLGLLDLEGDFRISDSDIDPSFPRLPKNEVFVSDDLLGDRSSPLIEWYENGGMPFIEKYLRINGLQGYLGEWICLDAYISQEDVSAERRRFSFIRGLLIKNEDFDDVNDLMHKQNLGGRWLPEKHENYYTYAGELYCFEDSTTENTTTLTFDIEKRKIRIKKGDPGYYPSVFWDDEDDGENEGQEKDPFPDEIEREVTVTKEFEILLPVMEYNWESYHSVTNDAGATTVLSKEIAFYLNLVDQPQTFDLYDRTGNKASINLYYHSDYLNNHTLVYLRKDLLDKFLAENNYKFLWAIWGERETTFKTNEKRDEFFKTHPYKHAQVFQTIANY